MNKEDVLRLIRAHLYALVGGALGLIVAVLFLTLGFWRTVLIVVLVALGAGIGALADRGRRLWDVVARFFPKDRDDDIRFKF
ncbi:MAG TPA: DUF2273 domain-containing protein [Candidatus Spyradocola merdavium]|nr:DUF2273 domain-containing protein [Candidatus Spyradocola merdavium]